MKNNMKAIQFAAAGLGILMVMAQPVSAQQKEKEGLGEYDQIIIKRKGEKGDKGEKGSKGDKDVKLTIVIKDDKVEVNGKPLAEFNNDEIAILKKNIIVRDGNTMRVTIPRQPRSPFQDGGLQGRVEEDRIIELRGMNKAFLGVSTEKSERGAVIMEVTEGSAAEKAGLKTGDIITKINDIKIESPQALTDAIGKFKPEEKIKVGYLRDGKSAELTATLGQRASAFSFNGREPMIIPFDNEDFNIEGFRGRNFNFNWNENQPKLGIKAQDTEDGKGVKVLEVDEESAAAKAGIKEGDIITSFDGKPINSVNELVDGNRAAREAKKISLPIEYLRDGKSQKVEVKVPRKLRTAEL